MVSRLFHMCSFRTAFYAVFALLPLFLPCPAKADFTSSPSLYSHGLVEALGIGDQYKLYNGKVNSGFNVAGGFFEGRASGIDASVTNYLSNAGNGNFHNDNTAELEGDQRMYAMLIDSRYEFNHDGGSDESPIHPYLLGGVGMAMYDHSTAPSAVSLAMQDGGLVPMLRVGAGVAYHMAKQLEMSLDYKEGLSNMSSYTPFSNGSQQSVDTHTLNIGMHYAF